MKMACWNVQAMQDLEDSVHPHTYHSLCLSSKILVYKAVVIYTLL